MILSSLTAIRPIAMMDSGVGGLPYLEEAAALLPGERFVYLADRAGFPYGTKSREEIESLVLGRISRLVERFDPKALVIACNTASQAALAAARKAFPELPIVGTVPAIKPAAERTRSGVIGIMATSHAIEDPYLDGLVSRYASNVRVLREGAQDLVSFVENRFVGSSAEERRAAVLPTVSRFVEGGADEIVLACTHFLHVAGDIESLASELAAGRAAREGREAGLVEVVDSRDGVARRLRAVLYTGDEAAPAPSAREPRLHGSRGLFLLSGKEAPEPVYAAFARRYGLEGPGLLDEA
jgi:glutamate racemase